VNDVLDAEVDLRLTRIPTVHVGMVVRRPPTEVFAAFADPAITTRFWFTRSTGRVEHGARLHWVWDQHGVSTDVTVRDVEPGRRIVFDWDDENPRTVELLFTPHGDTATHVVVTESGLRGSGDEVAAAAADSIGGFTMVLCAAKALLEHGVVLTVVDDHLP
jgi:uncharacterized protein YndB with AHSA1/START domain